MLVSEPRLSKLADSAQELTGQVVDGKFPLLGYLGGTDRTAVFLTERRGSQRAAIKLVLCEPQDVSAQLKRWEMAAKLSHPNLIRLFERGTCRIGGRAMLYTVMECADQNLAQLLPCRPLTALEATEMLRPLLSAVVFLHGNGLVHGDIKPANIMAIGEQLRLSSDGIYEAGSSTMPHVPGIYTAPETTSRGISPATDVWAMGVMLVEALTQRVPVWDMAKDGNPVLPEMLPTPFGKIVRNCLVRDAARRWTPAEISAHLSPAVRNTEEKGTQQAVPGRVKENSAQHRFLVPLAVAALVLMVAIAVITFARRSGEPNQTASVAPAAVIAQASPLPSPEPHESSATRGSVVHQVLPDVPNSASATIHGTIKIRVKVVVDPTGKVVGAVLERTGPSRYFASHALEAARQWQFSPAIANGRAVPSAWVLRFEFKRTGTNALPAEATS